MNIRNAFFCSVLFMLLGNIVAQPMNSSYRFVSNEAFQKGEFLKYKIHYGPVKVGYATLEVKPQSEVIRGRKCFHIICKNYTDGLFDSFYRVRDTYESFTDEHALISWQFNRDIQEGSYESYREIHFDHDKRKAFYHRNGEITPFEIPQYIQDVLSAYYYARATYDHSKLEKGDRISLRKFIDETTFALEALVEKREKIKIDGQHYRALKLKVMIEEAGLITDGSKITLWVSDDKNMIPLAFKSKLKIGSIAADLVEYKNLRNPFKARTI